MDTCTKSMGVAMCDKNVTDKSMGYTMVKMSQKLCYPKHESWENKHGNFDFVILLSSSFISPVRQQLPLGHDSSIYKFLYSTVCSCLVQNLGKRFFVMVVQLAGNCQRWIRIGICNKQLAQEVLTTYTRSSRQWTTILSDDFNLIMSVQFKSMLSQATNV